MLDPSQLIELERAAEAARAQLKGIPCQYTSSVKAWLEAELEVARRRALAVHDYGFIECAALIERRLRDPGSFLRDAEASLKINKVLEGRPHLRVIRGGNTAA
jgi:hypothetical protein